MWNGTQMVPTCQLRPVSLTVKDDPGRRGPAFAVSLFLDRHFLFCTFRYCSRFLLPIFLPVLCDSLEYFNSRLVVCFLPLVHSHLVDSASALSWLLSAGSGLSPCFSRGSDSKCHNTPFCSTGCCVTLPGSGTGSFHGTSWNRIGAQ